MKALKAVTMIVLVLGVIAVGALSLWLGRGIKVAVERFGPGIVGAPVTVGSVILTPWSGRGSIQNLVIGNPPGYKGAHALSVAPSRPRSPRRSPPIRPSSSVVVREPRFTKWGRGGNHASPAHAEGLKASRRPPPDGGGSPFIGMLPTGGFVAFPRPRSASRPNPLPGSISAISAARAVSARPSEFSARSHSAGKAASANEGAGDAAPSVMGRSAVWRAMSVLSASVSSHAC